MSHRGWFMNSMATMDVKTTPWPPGMYLSHGELDIPSLPNTLLPAVHSSFSIPPYTPHKTPMAPVNNNNANDFPSASGEFDSHPSQTPVSGYADHAVQTSTNDWSVGEHQDSVSGSRSGLRSEASFGKYDKSPSQKSRSYVHSPESTSSGTSYKAQTQNRDQTSFPRHCRSTTGLYAQPHHSSIPSRENSFASTASSDSESTVIPAPSNRESFFSC